MANYATLKAAIQAAIYENGNNEITGVVLQQTLLSMISSLGDGYQFMGIATPSTNPGTPDANVFYLASTAGTYTNFGGLVLGDGEIAILEYNGAWSKDSTGAASLETVNQLDQVVFTNTSTTYNADGSIYFGRITIISKSNVVTRKNIDTTVQPITGDTTYFVLRGDSVVASTIGQLKKNDLILIVETSGRNFIGGPLLPDYVNKHTVQINSTKTIELKLELGAYSIAGLLAANWYGKKYWRSKFIRCYGMSQFKFVTSETGLYVLVNYYDADYNYLSGTNYSELSNNLLENIPDNAAYFVISVRNSATSAGATDIPRPRISISGEFVDNPIAFNPRPSNGYQRLLIPVNVANPNASDAENIALQDSENILVDYGLLALPTQYDPNGEPIRLIIYCHGAGVNYDSDISSFPATDLLPEYWLSEGCAVMDIEGNPFNNTDEHGYIPQAIQSYIAAYDWVIRTYNIKKEIFLGGRSMGGGMVFEILQSRIPVIAACPVVPLCNELWWWEYMNAARRQFCAEKMGFVGTAPAWTSQNPMTNEEWEYIQANFDKLVKYAPFWRGVESLPNKDTLFGVGNVGTSVDNQTESDLYNSLHFKTKAPVKMFAVKDDATVNYQRNCKLMYQMLLNAAQQCEMRYFPSGGHHFELTEPYLLDYYVNSYGVTLVNVPLVYVEMLQFWRRYELNY